MDLKCRSYKTITIDKNFQKFGKKLIIGQVDENFLIMIMIKIEIQNYCNSKLGFKNVIKILLSRLVNLLDLKFLKLKLLNLNIKLLG